MDGLILGVEMEMEENRIYIYIYIYNLSDLSIRKLTFTFVIIRSLYC